MKRFLLAAILTISAGSLAFAGELDDESSVTNQAMNGTVVIRVDTRTNQTSILTTDKPVASEAEALSLVESGSFKSVAPSHIKNELDQDGGSSSWYFNNGCYGYNNGYNGCNNGYYGCNSGYYGCNYGYNHGYNNYYYNNMYWYGSWYSPCHSYYYGNYQYYYYSNYGW